MKMMHRVGGPLSLLVALVVTVALGTGYGGTAAAGPDTAAPAADAGRVIAQNAKGSMDSRIFGETAGGRKVTGTFVPLTFSTRDGKVFARGLLEGVIHKADGKVKTFGVMRTIRVKTINGVPASTRSSAVAGAACDVLHLVLGPLDLDLLGLQVHLNRVVLDIVAQAGPGNLLGNLLCAVVGLLDGGLDGVLGRLVNLLNRILAQLGLGL